MVLNGPIAARICSASSEATVFLKAMMAFTTPSFVISAGGRVRGPGAGIAGREVALLGAAWGFCSAAVPRASRIIQTTMPVTTMSRRSAGMPKLAIKAILQSGVVGSQACLARESNHAVASFGCS
jgi:hypothetical protein